MEKLSPDTATAAKVRDILDAAGMDAKLDDDGDVQVKGAACGGYVCVQEDDWLLRFESLYGAKDDATRMQKLALCNRINDRFRMARAHVKSRGNLGFDYYFPVKGGVDDRVVVLTFKRFTQCVVDGLRACDDDNIVQ